MEIVNTRRDFSPVVPIAWKERLSLRLSALHSALSTYGKPFDGGLLQTWVIAMSDAGIEEMEFDQAARHWTVSESEFPAPGQFIKWIMHRREIAESRDAIAALQERIRDEDEAERVRLEVKYEGWTNAHLADHISKLQPGVFDVPEESKRTRNRLWDGPPPDEPKKVSK